ncbi:MAG: AMP-binding protein [Mycobacteriaceae bacterium]|nr:AMP-binding protein [Mycobacteriaceae bacterium]
MRDAHYRDGYVPFPDADAARYRAAGIWQGRSLGELLRDAARRRGPALALVGDAQPFTYAQLDQAADRMAAGLRARGLAVGDRVVVQLPNGPDFVVVLFGLVRAGAIPVLTLPAHRSAEITHLAALSGAVGYVIADRAAGFDYRDLAVQVQEAAPAVRHVLVLGEPGPFEALAEVPCDLNDADPEQALPELDPSDIALMLVSGGTTGLPKLIARTHDDYHYNARASAAVCGLGETDVYLATLPVAHNFPLACPGILGTLAAGGAVAFTADPSPETAFAVIERHRVTVTAVVPPLAQLWCAAVDWEPADLSSLRLLQVGGARLAEANAREVEPRLGARLQQVFGMAEGLLNYTGLDDPEELVVATQGKPLSPADCVRVVDADGADVAPGAEGELITKGPYTISGYYRAAEHNARAFTPDGWYRSGDLVRRLPTGHLIVSGRVKDVINRGGENVSCDELEEHLLAYPGIRHAAAVGLPDESLGEKVCAALVVDDAMPTLREVKAFLADRGLAGYKHPDLLRPLSELPTTAVGKIDRRALAATLT